MKTARQEQRMETVSSIKYDLEPGKYIARTHSSHPSRNTLIKICSSKLDFGDPLLVPGRIRQELRFHRSMEKDPDHKFFVIQVLEEPE